MLKRLGLNFILSTLIISVFHIGRDTQMITVIFHHIHRLHHIELRFCLNMLRINLLRLILIQVFRNFLVLHHFIEIIEVFESRFFNQNKIIIASIIIITRSFTLRLRRWSQRRLLRLILAFLLYINLTKLLYIFRNTMRT